MLDNTPSTYCEAHSKRQQRGGYLREKANTAWKRELVTYAASSSSAKARASSDWSAPGRPWLWWCRTGRHPSCRPHRHRPGSAFRNEGIHQGAAKGKRRREKKGRESHMCWQDKGFTASGRRRIVGSQHPWPAETRKGPAWSYHLGAMP